VLLSPRMIASSLAAVGQVYSGTVLGTFAITIVEKGGFSMAKIIGEPTIERLVDALDIENASWVGAEINFHVVPEPGESWAKDLLAGCVIDGVRAQVPEAVASLREWDKDPESSFYCYVPAGYLRDGARMTLQVHPRDKHGRPKEDVIWQGDFRVRVEDDEYRVMEMVSLSTGSQEKLEALPGIGPKIAEAIIAYRHLNGPFTSIEGIADVPMVGAATLEGLRDLILP
jgi:competence ComEA-like helix-hairpin-helix protein